MISDNAVASRLGAVIEAGADYGKSDSGAGKRVLIEFVSAQPNVVLTVTHGRGGVVGDTIAALLSATGHEVEREFYVNDGQDSRPMRAFTRAVLAVYRHHCGVADVTPESDACSGDYISTIADRIYETVGDSYANLTTPDALPVFLDLAFKFAQQDQRDILASLQIRFDNWTSERELARSGAVNATLSALTRLDRAVERGGALWLSSTQFGEPHDYVLRRVDGTVTYLAGDLAYHRRKFERGFDRLIDVWSADHSTYVSRTRAGITAMGYDANRIDILVFKKVRVLKDGTELKGGRDTALAEVPLSDVIEAVGADEVRFQLLFEDRSQTVDLNVDGGIPAANGRLARIRQAIRNARAASNGVARGQHQPDGVIGVVDAIDEFPKIVAEAAASLETHVIARYALRLAIKLEAIIDSQRVDANVFSAGAIALENALELLGIAPGTAVIETHI